MMAKWQKVHERRYIRDGAYVDKVQDEDDWLANAHRGPYAYVATAEEGMKWLDGLLDGDHAATMAEGLQMADDMGTDARVVPGSLADQVIKASSLLDKEPDPYASLSVVLGDAFYQAAKGKGRERHANDLPFEQQPIMQGSRKFGLGSPLGQVDKKTGEALGMARRGEYAAAEAELLGAIVYAAAAVLRLRELAGEDDDMDIKIGGSS